MDYFFYRLYRMYDKHGDPPLCSSICYLSFCLDVIFLIVYVYLVNTIDRYIWLLEDFYPILIADWMIFLVPICIIIILFALLYYSIEL